MTQREPLLSLSLSFILSLLSIQFNLTKKVPETKSLLYLFFPRVSGEQTWLSEKK